MSDAPLKGGDGMRHQSRQLIRSFALHEVELSIFVRYGTEKI